MAYIGSVLALSISERYFALPFMTILEPSAKSDKNAKRRHKTTLQWTIQMLMQVVRVIKYPLKYHGLGC